MSSYPANRDLDYIKCKLIIFILTEKKFKTFKNVIEL